METGSTIGGAMASREHNKSLSRKENFTNQKALIYVEYEDHVLFRNCDSSKIKPSIRKTVGWVTFENTEALCVCSDVPVERLPNEKNAESGLVILKSTILNKRELGSGKIFKQDRTAKCGQKSPINGEKKNARTDRCKR
jgi:hypothetical protein